ncbi:MAG: hypothetical protein NTX03_15375 [Bacteroidetes bacterium]|nr:hypothetical protein [Bacteroidota bacterium]
MKKESKYVFGVLPTTTTVRVTRLGRINLILLILVIINLLNHSSTYCQQSNLKYTKIDSNIRQIWHNDKCGNLRNRDSLSIYFEKSDYLIGRDSNFIYFLLDSPMSYFNDSDGLYLVYIVDTLSINGECMVTNGSLQQSMDIIFDEKFRVNTVSNYIH